MKFLFVGNRSYVFEKMLDLKCDIVAIFAVKDSYLEKKLQKLNIDYKRIESKTHLINNIEAIDFDCLVSNGCPYILPVSDMKKSHQLFVNIHPSLLPDLKGKNPINGAVLFDRRHGVTCHHMDDGIDTGKVIEQIEIPITEDTELGLLYQISFMAEGEVFKNAFDTSFKSNNLINENVDAIYYSRSKEDMIITKKDTLNQAIRKIRAFGIPSLGTKFFKKDKEYIIIGVKIISNNSIKNIYKNAENGSVLFSYDNKVLVIINNKYVQFEMVDSSGIQPRESFFGFSLKS
jgi:methionyl-tRNA formyltransferase